MDICKDKKLLNFNNKHPSDSVFNKMVVIIKKIPSSTTRLTNILKNINKRQIASNLDLVQYQPLKRSRKGRKYFTLLEIAQKIDRKSILER